LEVGWLLDIEVAGVVEAGESLEVLEGVCHIVEGLLGRPDATEEGEVEPR